MDPRKFFNDKRQSGYCVYCGGPVETADHVPSKVLLDEPFPRDLPTVDACERCNHGFSLDEEYLACFIACTIVGSTDPELQRRPSIRRKLSENPSLRALIGASRTQGEDGTLLWRPNNERVENVVTKLARGHIAFEEGTPRLDAPGTIDCTPLILLEPQEADDLVGSWPPDGTWPEIGSRAFFRASGMPVPHPPGLDGWITIQPGRYRYRSHANIVQMIFSEYLCCTVQWEL